jgi:hypothetical protein
MPKDKSTGSGSTDKPHKGSRKLKAEAKANAPVVVSDIMPPGTRRDFIPAGKAARAFVAQTVGDAEKMQEQKRQEQIARAEREQVRAQKIAEEKKLELQREIARLLRESGSRAVM